MALPLNQASPVFKEILAELALLEERMLAHPEALQDEQFIAETYKWIFSITQVAFDCFVWGDSTRPQFVDIVGPTKKWGGDNTDAFYQYCPIDPTRTYWVRGRSGDAVYLSLTVYGGPNDGRYSERIIGSLNDRELDVNDRGEFRFWISATPQDGPGILIEADAVAAITRDYLADPTNGERTRWQIACGDDCAPWRETPADLTRRMTAALTWIRDQAAIVPIPLGVRNRVDPPYPVPSTTFGWAAGDAAYAMGSFGLSSGQSLVLRGVSPECAFWNLCCWNPYLHTYNAAHDRVSINSETIQLEADGSWEIVVSDHDPDHPNWVCTQGHSEGLLWFRWFLPATTPAPITVEVRG